MRRHVVIVVDAPELDERALRFDVRRLEPGDSVEVFIAPERQWKRGRFRISTAGDAVVDVRDGAIPFEDALAAGLRRVLH
jgi:hypothetical protein